MSLNSSFFNDSSLLYVSSTQFSTPDNINYIIFGTPIILVNLLVFAVLISDRSLLHRSALMAGLTSGNFYLGLHMVCFGVYRLAYDQQQLNAPASFHLCARLVFTLFYPMAFNTVAIFLILASLERLLAIATPNWFRLHWTIKNSWMVALMGHVTSWAVLVIGLTAPQDLTAATWSCNVLTIFGPKYVLFLSGFSASAGILSAIFTISALGFGLCRFSHTLSQAGGDAGRIRKQVQLTKSMATITCFEVAFMAVPNILSLLTNTGYKLPAFIRAQNSTYTNAVNCMVLFVASMVFNSRFRRAAIILLHAQRLAGSMGKVDVQQIKPAGTAVPVKARDPNE